MSHENVEILRRAVDAFNRRDCGDRVVMPNRAVLRGRGGIEVEARSTLLVTLRNGRITEWRLYQERAEALEAVGLRE